MKTNHIEGVSQSSLERARKIMEELKSAQARVKNGTANPDERMRFEAGMKRARDLDPRVLVD